MKLTKKILEDIISEVIEEGVVGIDGLFYDEPVGLIDEETYNDYKEYLNEYIDTEEHRVKFENNHMPYGTFSDMKGFETYITPLAGVKKKIVQTDTIILKQTESEETLDEANEFLVGNVVNFRNPKSGKSSMDYFIVDINDDRSTLRKVIKPSITIKKKANDVAKYEDWQDEMVRIKNSETQGEQLDMFS